MATKRQEYGRSAARGAAGSAGLSGAGLGLGLAKAGTSAFTVGVGAAATPALLPIAGLALGVAGIAGLANYMSATKEYDAQKKLQKQQAKLAEKARAEQEAQVRQKSAQVAKSRRRGEAFDFEPGDEIMVQSAGGGSTYDNFMMNTYGG